MVTGCDVHLATSRRATRTWCRPAPFTICMMRSCRRPFLGTANMIGSGSAVSSPVGDARSPGVSGHSAMSVMVVAAAAVAAVVVVAAVGSDRPLPTGASWWSQLQGSQQM